MCLLKMKKVIKFDNLPAAQQKEKLIKAGLVPAKNKADRRKQVEEYLNERNQTAKSNASVSR